MDRDTRKRLDSVVTPDRTRPEDGHPIDALDEETLDRVTAGGVGLALLALPVAVYLGDIHPNAKVLLGGMAAMSILMGGYSFRYPWFENGIILTSLLWKILPPIANVLAGIGLFTFGLLLLVVIALA